VFLVAEAIPGAVPSSPEHGSSKFRSGHTLVVGIDAMPSGVARAPLGKDCHQQSVAFTWEAVRSQVRYPENEVRGDRGYFPIDMSTYQTRPIQSVFGDFGNERAC
jgi:hypothetical protein